MSSVFSLRHGLLLLAAVTVAACGGDAADRDLAAMPQDTFIKPMVREPLTEADLAGTAMAELSLELPWTGNRVSRDAAAGAPAVSIRSADVVGHEGFDRVTFTTEDPLPALGYEIRFAAAGESLVCGTGTHEVGAAGGLVVTLAPAAAADDNERWVPTGLRAIASSRMSRAGLLCDEDGTVTWLAELAQGDQIRVLELRDPGRIVVDVR